MAPRRRARPSLTTAVRNSLGRGGAFDHIILRTWGAVGGKHARGRHGAAWAARRAIYRRRRHRAADARNRRAPRRASATVACGGGGGAGFGFVMGKCNFSPARFAGNGREGGARRGFPNVATLAKAFFYQWQRQTRSVCTYRGVRTASCGVSTWYTHIFGRRTACAPL